MSDLNRAMLIGNITQDPSLRMAGDKAVCNFRIATNYKKKDVTNVEYHNIVCWDKTAENIGTFLTRGSKVFVEGRLQTREWTAADGVKKQTTEIVADQVIFLDKKDYPARSIQSITNMIVNENSVTGTNATEAFVMESMDKQDNVQEIKLSDIPF